MNKKVILSALLASGALLGTTAAANAATSAVKAESKLVCVENDGAELYKNSKLQESTEAAKGTVYKVNGYRDIDGKKYYRVYQEEKGENVYKGYISDKDATDLKKVAIADKDRFVGVTAEKAPAWKNLYLNKKIKTYNGVKHSSNFEVKHAYKLGDKTFYSMYRGNKWMGYMDAAQVKALSPQNVAKDKQAYKVVEDWKTYNDIYFNEKGKLTKGEKVTVKRIYTFSTGRQYGSVYNAKGKWLGYANMKGLVEDKVVAEDSQKIIAAANEAIKKGEEILSKAQATKDSKAAAQKVITAAKETVKSGNLENIKKVPEQITKAIKDLKQVAFPMEIQKVRDAIQRADETLKNAGSVSKDKVEKVAAAVKEGQKVITAAKDNNASSEDVNKAVNAINKAVNDLGLKATKFDIEKLEAVLEDAKYLVDNTTDKDVENRPQIKNLVEEGNKVLANAKKGEATGKQVQEATKALEDELMKVK